ncbi:hypothetical protein GQX74_004270 [Glossina fuscipes]|nr:hypothetical protein GQX74_004270 [Glossina fuscipes]
MYSDAYKLLKCFGTCQLHIMGIFSITCLEVLLIIVNVTVGVVSYVTPLRDDDDDDDDDADDGDGDGDGDDHYDDNILLMSAHSHNTIIKCEITLSSAEAEIAVNGSLSIAFLLLFSPVLIECIKKDALQCTT